jgi:hypothetical protein
LATRAAAAGLAATAENALLRLNGKHVATFRRPERLPCRSPCLRPWLAHDRPALEAEHCRAQAGLPSVTVRMPGPPPPPPPPPLLLLLLLLLLRRPRLTIRG